jgi:hypothetical protein
MQDEIEKLKRKIRKEVSENIDIQENSDIPVSEKKVRDKKGFKEI